MQSQYHLVGLCSIWGWRIGIKLWFAKTWFLGYQTREDVIGIYWIDILVIPLFAISFAYRGQWYHKPLNLFVLGGKL
jgi:hypothetical protein